jgi:hypothetical protein
VKASDSEYVHQADADADASAPAARTFRVRIANLPRCAPKTSASIAALGGLAPAR